MLPFARVGFALGSACIVRGGLARWQMRSSKTHRKIIPIKPQISLNNIDYRVLMLSALLPDMIDNPIGDLLFRSYFGTSRIFCYTFLFLVILTSTGVYLYRKRHKIWLLLLALGTFTYLVLDFMWTEPRALLWPIFGITLPAEKYATFGNWISEMWNELIDNPSIYVPEVTGVFIIIVFFTVLIRRREFDAFIRYGTT